eukprot:1158789-Pelagomonas_calceolata.AAC.8
MSTYAIPFRSTQPLRTCEYPRAPAAVVAEQIEGISHPTPTVGCAPPTSPPAHSSTPRPTTTP